MAQSSPAIGAVVPERREAPAPRRPAAAALRSLATLALLLAPLCANAAPPPEDIDKGKEINGVCAACHGDYGQGGKRGEYPRLAGQSPIYLRQQLTAFRKRERINLPMFPYTQERELSEEDIRDIAAYLTSIKLPTKPPEFRDDEDALTRLLAMDKVMIVPRSEGDIARGGEVYERECADCHGANGRGKGKYPSLVGQYTNYLRKQADAFLSGGRKHYVEDAGGGEPYVLKDPDLRDILAYLTTLQQSGE